MFRRMIDVTLAFLGLMLLWPVMLLVAVLIKLDSKGSVLFNRGVIGKGGRPFELLGFRTMLIGSAHQDPETRLTRAGAFVRNISLDHPPQLINLLKGDLSMVGPRAMEREWVDLTDPVWRRYVSVTPGLFNDAVLKLGREWSASRQTHPTLNQALELEYLQKRSPGYDLALTLTCLWGLLASGGNVKARGQPDPDVATEF